MFAQDFNMSWILWLRPLAAIDMAVAGTPASWLSVHSALTSARSKGLQTVDKAALRVPSTMRKADAMCGGRSPGDPVTNLQAFLQSTCFALQQSLHDPHVPTTDRQHQRSLP